MSISAELRLRVQRRASGRCEYCLLDEEDSIKRHEVDHIVPRKHGGADSEENLAWACFQCNRYKGSEVGGYDTITGQLAPLYNPRLQVWQEHFSLVDGEILGRTAIGRVTARLLQLNRPLRLEVRRLHIAAGRYP